MHAIYLLQADIKTEVCCGSSGQVYKGHFSSLLRVLGLHQPIEGLSLLAVTVCACRWTVGVHPCLSFRFLCLLLVCWCSSQSAALVSMLCDWIVRPDIGPLVLVSA
jgi:hypothetical protein